MSLRDELASLAYEKIDRKAEERVDELYKLAIDACRKAAVEGRFEARMPADIVSIFKSESVLCKTIRDKLQKKLSVNDLKIVEDDKSTFENPYYLINFFTERK